LNVKIKIYTYSKNHEFFTSFLLPSGYLLADSLLATATCLQQGSKKVARKQPQNPFRTELKIFINNLLAGNFYVRSDIGILHDYMSENNYYFALQ
jgi:hypothetical protein